MKQSTYHLDAYSRSLDTVIKSVGATSTGTSFVVLEDTIFYPEGGGQPADQGTISISAVQGERRVTARVIDVQMVSSEIRHVLDAPLVLDELTDRPVIAELDWQRRFDHMQQHSAQHLLTAIADTQLGWSTTAFHLGPELSDVELATPSISPRSLEQLESMIASEIRAARPIRSVEVKPEQLAQMNVRSRGLPEDHEGPVRLVEIDGLDLNTCGGTHLRSTAEIGGLSLIATETLRGGTRVLFAAGERLRRRMTAHEARNASLRALLGAPDAELVDVVRLRLDREKELNRSARRLSQELAEALAASMAATSETAVSGYWPAQEMPFLQALARRLIELAPHKKALLAGGQEHAGCFVIVAGPSSNLCNELASVGARACKILEGRGGGRAPIYQGKASRLERRNQVLELLESLG